MKQIQPILNELDPIFEISLKKKPHEERENFIKNVTMFIVSTLDQMYTIIKYFEDKDNPEIKRIHAIKNDKEYLDRYINAFKINNQFYHSIGDIENMQLSFQSYKIFENFKKDSVSTLNSFAEVNTILFSFPDIARNVRILKRKKNLTLGQKEYIRQYNEYKNIQKIAKFFEGYNVTRKGIVTSTSIYLYRIIYAHIDIPKNTLKNVIESIFIKLEEQVHVYPNNMEGVYLKTIFKKLPIFAYPSKNEKTPFIDMDKISYILEKRIQKNKDEGKNGMNDQLEKYFENISKSLLQGIKPSSTS